MPVIDLTEQPPAQDIGPQRYPKYTHHSHLAKVRAAIGVKPEYYDEYRFTGRTYRKRDVLTSPNHEL